MAKDVIYGFLWIMSFATFVFSGLGTWAKFMDNKKIDKRFLALSLIGLGLAILFTVLYHKSKFTNISEEKNKN